MKRHCYSQREGNKNINQVLLGYYNGDDYDGDEDDKNDDDDSCDDDDKDDDDDKEDEDHDDNGDYDDDDDDNDDDDDGVVIVLSCKINFFLSLQKDRLNHIRRDAAREEFENMNMVCSWAHN